MATLGDLVVRLKANNDQFNRNMKKSQSRLASFAKTAKKTLTLAGLAAAAATVGGLARQLKELDAVAKESAKLGMMPEKLAGLQVAFEQTGVSARSGTIALQRLTRRVSEAAAGSGVAVKALKELGLSAEALNKLSADQQLAKIADAMMGVENQADKVRLAFALFDSEGVGLLNTLEEGSAGLQRFQDAAQAAGVTMSRDQLKVIEDLNDEWHLMTIEFKGAANVLLVEWAPAIKGTIRDVKALVKEVKITGKWLSDLLGAPKTKTKEELLAMRDAIVKSGMFPGGHNNDALAEQMGIKTNKTKAAEDAAAAAAAAAPPANDLAQFDSAVKQAMRDVAQLQGKTTDIEETIAKYRDDGASEIALGFLRKQLELKEELLKKEEQLKKKKEAQQGLDRFRFNEQLQDARTSANQAKSRLKAPGGVGIATRGSSEALSSILKAGRKIPEQALAQHKKANKLLSDLLEEQRAEKVAEFTAQGAV